MPKALDLTGRRVGMLLILERDFSIKSNNAMWKCLCDCGNTKSYPASNIKEVVYSGTVSCGCYRKKQARIQMTTHGLSKTVEFSIWQGMRQRCYNKNDDGYKNYGARGIEVCDRWNSSFENFYKDMGPKPSPKHSIDRFPNMNGNYEPNNCRWATSRQQTRNTRYNQFVEIEGKRLCVKEWSEVLGVSTDSIYSRLYWNKKSGIKTIQEAVKSYYYERY